MVEIEKKALIQIQGINKNQKKGRSHDTVAEYDFSHVTYKNCHSVPECSCCIDSTKCYSFPVKHPYNRK